MSAKYDKFVEALEALCAEHAVVLTPRHDSILVIDADAQDADLVKGALDDGTNDGARA